MFRRRVSPKFRGRGVILAMTLVCLLVVSVIGGLLLRAALAQQRAAWQYQRQMQALWLTESAAGRAAAQTATNAEYQGETWTLSTEDLGGRDPAVIEIRVTPLPGETGKKQVRVETRYPNELPRRVLHTRQWVIPE
jgi:Tfp pilus assembly protein PilX